MPKKLQEKEDHLFKRGQVWWLYFREHGRRVRVSLKTKSKHEALKKLQGYRIKGPGTNFDAIPIHQIIDEYIERQNESFEFVDSTARSARGQLNSIAKVMQLRSNKDLHPNLPQAVYTDLQYEKKSNGAEFSEASCQSYAMLTHAFMKWCFNENLIRQLPEPVKYSKRRTVPKKDVVVSPAAINALLEFTEDTNQKFIFYCGFVAGMRRNEISMAKKSWFVDRTIQIPAEDRTQVFFERRSYRAKSYTKEFVFKTKSKMARKIPIRRDFHEFLQVHFLTCVEFGLERKGRGYGKIYRYDIRRPFETGIAAFNHAYPGVLPPKVTIHTMRHSFISNLANSRNPLYSALQISAWSGDELRTIQSNYFHSRIEGDELDAMI